MSTSYTAEEFLARLSSGEEAAPGALTLTGMAQAVDGTTDSIEFAVGTRCTTWTSVPLAIVERVEVHDTVTCRAFTSLAQFVAGSGAIAGPGGRLLALKGRRPDDEMADLPAGWAVVAVERVTVPLLDAERHVVLLQRQGAAS